jgi:hypothetical protein
MFTVTSRMGVSLPRQARLIDPARVARRDRVRRALARVA